MIISEAIIYKVYSSSMISNEAMLSTSRAVYEQFVSVKIEDGLYLLPKINYVVILHSAYKRKSVGH